MQTSARIPDHVPQNLVRDFSIYDMPGMQAQPNGCPHAAVRAALEGAPPVFWGPNNTRDGLGVWVVVSAEDQREVLQDPITFSSMKNNHLAALGESVPQIPFEIDPPDHTAYRALLNPLLSPRAVTSMEPMARERAVALIESFRDRGGCEVMQDFALPFAVYVFLNFLGLPYERSPEFLRWAEDTLRGPPDVRNATVRTIHDFLSDLAEQRRREPGDDFMTYLVQAQFEGRALTDKEIRGISYLLLIAGLDTVAAAIGFDMLYLAQNPQAQARLRAEPQTIRSAVEEMFRAFPTIGLLRVATRDVDLKGAPVKKGDWILCGSYVANFDPHEFPDPLTVDFEREDNRHNAFGYGPHRCLGSHLARRELIIALEEFLARLPPFRIRAGEDPILHGGFVFGVDRLVLDWT